MSVIFLTEFRTRFVYVSRLGGFARRVDEPLPSNHGVEEEFLKIPVSKELHMVGKGNRLSSSALTTSVDDGLSCTFDFRKGYLYCHLHRMETKLRRLPLLKRLEHERNCADVGAIKSSRINAHHSGSTAFEFRYQRDVVCVVLFVDV